MYMKKILYIVFILLGIGIMSSCTKEGGNQNSIVGSWKIVNTEYDGDTFTFGTVWTFEKGGGLLIDGYPYTQWRYDEKEKIYKVGASGYFEVLTISSTKLRIIFEGRLNVEFDKVR